MIFAEIKSPARWPPDHILGFVWPSDHKPQCHSTETRPWTTGEPPAGPPGPTCGASPVEENEDPSPRHRAARISRHTLVQQSPPDPPQQRPGKKRLEYLPKVFQKLAASPEMSTLSSKSVLQNDSTFSPRLSHKMNTDVCGCKESFTESLSCTPFYAKSLLHGASQLHMQKSRMRRRASLFYRWRKLRLREV